MNWVLPGRLSERCRGWMDHIPDGGKSMGQRQGPRVHKSWGRIPTPATHQLHTIRQVWILSTPKFSPALSFLIWDAGVITMISTGMFVSGKRELTQLCRKYSGQPLSRNYVTGLPI